MTRRILVMLLAFTALVLVGAVVPLTLNATSHDRSSFIQAAAGTARTDAVVAQARLDQLSGVVRQELGSCDRAGWFRRAPDDQGGPPGR